MAVEPYYDHCGITIYHGNCREVLPELVPVDLLLTDPPYGLGEKLRGGVTGMMKGCFNEMVEDGWDVKPTKDEMALVVSSGRDFIIWGGNYFCDCLPPSQCVLVWDKMNGTNNMADCEIALTSINKRAQLFSRHHFSKGCRGKLHPSQKPLPVIKWAMGMLEWGACIDPYMGSGTTLRAAKDLGRHATGIDISERNCEIAANRLRQEVLF